MLRQMKQQHPFPSFYLLVFLFFLLNAGDPNTDPLCRGESQTLIDPDRVSRDVDEASVGEGDVDEAMDASRDSSDPVADFLSGSSRESRAEAAAEARLLLLLLIALRAARGGGGG